MCVLIIKPRGVKMPAKDILKKCHKANPHGCGFISERHFYKTLYFDEFLEKLNEVEDSENCIIHFRLATHGSINVHNCHPFRDRKTNTFFAHNGVLPIESKNDLTDSEICFRAEIVPALKDYGFDSKEFDRVVNRIRHGTRFAIMHKGEVKTYGDFQTLNNIKYSNLRWLNYYFI